MLEANLEAVQVVAELGVVVEEEEPGQVVHGASVQVLRDKPGGKWSLEGCRVGAKYLSRTVWKTWNFSFLVRARSRMGLRREQVGWVTGAARALKWTVRMASASACCCTLLPARRAAAWVRQSQCLDRPPPVKSRHKTVPR